MNTEATLKTSSSRRVPIGPLLFCAAMMLVGMTYLVIVGWRFLRREAPPRNIAADAEALLRESKPAPLSETLEQLLEDARNYSAPSKEHSLLGKKAPEFTGKDVFGHEWSLTEKLKDGPGIVVFYLGYHCNHCVSQLFDMNEDYSYFRELGAGVVALSPDTAANTAAKYREHGPFGFPVLHDASNKIAKQYDVVAPAKDGKPEELLHGTFVIDQSGIVRWATFGEQPFSDNRTLLGEIAKINNASVKRR